MSDATASQPSPDRNLLFGIFALQMDFVRREALIAAMNAWVLDKVKPLGDFLVDQNALRADQRSALEVLVNLHLKQHQGDVERSLAALNVPGRVRQELHSLGDADVDAGLSCMPTAPQAANALPCTTLEKPGSVDLRYHVLRPHGKGGIGEVFVALDQELNREVALKEIQDQHADDVHSRSRFVREAEITGGLEHPGIVPVYGLGQYGDGRPYYAMRFIQGETLKDAIARYHGLSASPRVEPGGSPEFELRALLTRFIAVCNTIAYAHSRGVIHRDIKPANIMLGKFGETLVVDWGMAKALIDAPVQSAGDGVPEPVIVPRLSDGVLTQAGAAIGTPAYMSPEQALGRLDQLGPASDIYSLGATLYTMLTGRPPIKGKEIGAILRAAQRGEWLPPRQVKPDLPLALDAICRKAMALKPERRYSTALELAADLEHWLADEPVTAHQEPLLARLGRWTRRNRLAVALSAAVLIVVSTLVVAALLLDSAAKSAAAAKQRADDQEEAAAEMDRLRRIAEGQRQEATTQRHEAEIKRQEAEANGAEADRQRQLVQRLLYASRMNMADQAWDEGNEGLTDRLLKDQWPPSGRLDLRGFEWFYLWRRAHASRLELPTPTAALSADGSRLATFESGTHVIRDATTGKPLLTIRSPLISNMRSTALSPDGKRLAICGRSQRLEIYDTATGNRIGTYPFPPGWFGNITQLLFSPNGRHLACAFYGHSLRFKIWDVERNQEFLSYQDDRKDSFNPEVVFSPNGDHIFMNGWGSFQSWDMSTGKEDNQARALKLPAGMALCAFSPDSRQVLLRRIRSGSYLTIQEAATGKLIHKLDRHTGEVTCASYSPNGKRIATGSVDHTVRLWNAENGQEIAVFKGHIFPVRKLAFSGDGKLLLSHDDQVARIWDLEKPADPSATLRPNIRIRHNIVLDDSGQTIVVYRQNSILICDLRGDPRAHIPFTHPGNTECLITISPDGSRIAALGVPQPDVVTVWDQSGKQIQSLRGQPNPGGILRFSPNSKMLAGSANGEIKVWELAAGRELLTLKSDYPIPLLAFSPDSQRLACAALPHEQVGVWDTADGKLIARTDIRMPRTLLAFTPDGRSLITAEGYELVEIDLTEAAQKQRYIGHHGRIYCAAFSPDGLRMATGADDATIRIWDRGSRQQTLVLKGHATRVEALAFSQDSQRLISIDRLNNLRNWDAKPPTAGELSQRRAKLPQAQR
jgi:WD40 repeat protein/serine/threonine protein kinase